MRFAIFISALVLRSAITKEALDISGSITAIILMLVFLVADIIELLAKYDKKC